MADGGSDRKRRVLAPLGRMCWGCADRGYVLTVWVGCGGWIGFGGDGGNSDEGSVWMVLRDLVGRV